jgi:hypothetical protein
MTTTKPVYIVDLIGTVVQAVTAEVLAQIQANETAALGTTGITTINYQYGHFRELIVTLGQWDADASGALRVAKYPMIYVVQDFVEHRGKLAGVYADINLQVIVCHQTDGDYKITDRYTNVFKPVLYPIYYSFMKQLALSNMTFPSSPDLIGHDKYDRSFWGTSKVVGSGGTDRSVLNDFVDAIDIQNLQLKIDYQPC